MLATSFSTALNYALAATPDPLQVSTTASITILAAKRNRNDVTYNKLQVQIAVSPDPNALTTDISSIVAIAPNQWKVAPDPDYLGCFTFTPPNGAVIVQPTDALMFVLQNININAQVGNTTLTLSEFVNGNSTANQIAYPLTKFPQGFVLGQFKADKPLLEAGGTATLSWTGGWIGSDQGTCTLQYGNNEPVPIPVGTNQYPVSNLQQTTTFSLLVKDAAHTLQAERQCTVTVLRPEIVNFGTVGELTEAQAGSGLSVYWQTQNATRCDLYVNGLLYASFDPNIDPTVGTGISLPSIPGPIELFLRAYDSTGTISTSASFPVLLYQFDPLPAACTVGPMPFQLVVRPDGKSLLAACGYPYTLNAFDVRITYSNSGSYLYEIDTYNLTTNQLIAQGGLQPWPDPNTQCVTRLVVNPADTYRFYFFSALGWITDIDTSTTPSTVKIVQIYGYGHSDKDMAIGIAGTPRSGAPYPAICYHNDAKITDYAYLSADDKLTTPGFYLSDQLPALTGIPAADVPNDIWSIAVVPSHVLLSLSIALGSTKSLVRVSLDEKKLQLIKIDNFKTGLFPPSIVFLANDNARGYCVSGIETIQPDPNTPPKDQPVIVAMNGNDEEIRRIPVPAEVRAMVASRDSYHLYATLDNDTVVRISTGAGPNQVINKFQVGSHPWALAISPNGNRLYVSDVVDSTATTNPPNGKVWVVEISDSVS